MPKIISLPWLPWFDGLTLGPGLILLRHGATPDVLPHEMCHVRQMRSDGWLRWLWRYYGSRHWRLEYEAEAYAVSVANGANHGITSAWSERFISTSRRCFPLCERGCRCRAWRARPCRSRGWITGRLCATSPTKPTP